MTDKPKKAVSPETRMGRIAAAARSISEAITIDPEGDVSTVIGSPNELSHAIESTKSLLASLTLVQREMTALTDEQKADAVAIVKARIGG